MEKKDEILFWLIMIILIIILVVKTSNQDQISNSKSAEGLKLRCGYVIGKGYTCGIISS